MDSPGSSDNVKSVHRGHHYFCDQDIRTVLSEPSQTAPPAPFCSDLMPLLLKHLGQANARLVLIIDQHYPHGWYSSPVYGSPLRAPGS
jgi:hypothetical protein